MIAKSRSTTFFILLIAGCWLLINLTGCYPTYPKGKLKESIVKICKKEYKLDVKVDTLGKTIAIYLPLSEDLLDFNFGLTKSAGEKIDDVITSATRVVLSTDADFDFYCVIVHDARIPEVQFVIIKYVYDVKRALLNDISRGEYGRRILFDLKLNPQAQKERAVEEVFEKMGIENKWQSEVMNDFFRSEPTALGDIGYWNGRFFIKDITLPEFLAEQIANRMKIEFREDKDISASYMIKSSKGSYQTKEGKRFFRLEVQAEPKIFTDIERKELPDVVFRTALTIINKVLYGYKYEDFDYFEILDIPSSRVLKVSKSDLESLRKNKISFEDLVKK